MKTQTIIELTVNNIKAIKVASWRPKKGEVNVIAGRNGQGKTAMLIALGMLFIPKKHWPKDPVRHGEEHGSIKLETENFKIEMIVYKDKPAKLTVWKLLDGAFEKRTSPRSILDSFVNGMAFSVTAFNGEADVLMELAGVTFDDLDEQHDGAYAARTSANADYKAARTILERMPYHEDAPTEEVSVTDLMAEVDRIYEHNKSIGVQRMVVDRLATEATEMDRDHKNKKDLIATLKSRLESEECDLEDLEAALEENQNNGKIEIAKLDSMAEQSDEEPRAAIASASEVNDQVRANKERVAQNIRVAELQNAAEKKDAAVKAVAAAREERIRTSNMPLPDLGFDDDGRVTYGGVVFDDLSTSERIRVQLNIGAALNPNFRVITIEHGNDLDDDAKAQIAAFAAEHDVMVLAEMVGDREGALVIEAGEVAE